MNLETSKVFTRHILSRVSRTFALNIKILHGVEFDFVATSYLICRFIDTIEDSPILSSPKQISLLKDFIAAFQSSDPRSFLPLISEAQNISENPDENELIRRFSEVIFLYHSFPDTYRVISQDMILTMAQGMMGFIKKYSQRKQKILKDEEEMNLYCYYVAGTVGEILTRLFSLRIPSPESRAIMEAHTRDFGLALQMTNIIKDFGDDRKRGWSYIPLTLLKQADITVNDYYKGLKPPQIKKIQDILIPKIETYLENSLKYCLAIPVQRIRYRLFCLIPLFLSIKTIYLLKKNEDKRITKNKISRKTLFSSIITIYIISPSNIFIKIYYFLIKKRIL